MNEERGSVSNRRMFLYTMRRFLCFGLCGAGVLPGLYSILYVAKPTTSFAVFLLTFGLQGFFLGALFGFFGIDPSGVPKKSRAGFWAAIVLTCFFIFFSLLAAAWYFNSNHNAIKRATGREAERMLR